MWESGPITGDDDTTWYRRVPPSLQLAFLRLTEQEKENYLH